MIVVIDYDDGDYEYDDQYVYMHRSMREMYSPELSGLGLIKKKRKPTKWFALLVDSRRSSSLVTVGRDHEVRSHGDKRAGSKSG